MAEQQFYQRPNFRKDEDHQVYDDASLAGSQQGRDISNGAQQSVDNIDNLLNEIGASESQPSAGAGASESPSTDPANSNSPAEKSLKNLEDGATDQFGSGFNANDSSVGNRVRVARFFSSKNGRRLLIGGGVAGLGVGGAMGILSLFSGPLEFIHLAQQLQQFHFSAQEDASDNRFSKLVRYIREPSKPERTRLGVLGNKFADTFEKKLNASGIESSYTKGLGYRDGYVVNKENENFKGKNTAQIREELMSKYGVPASAIEISAGTGAQQIRINTTKYGYMADMRLSRATLQDAGYSKVTSAMAARIMGKRAGVTWHPIKNLDKKINQKASDIISEKYKEWRANRASEVKFGSTDIVVDGVTKEVPKDANGKPVANYSDSQSKDAQAATQEVASEGSNANKAVASGDTEAVGKFQSVLESKVTKVGGGGVAVVGIACIVRGLSANVVNLRKVQVVEPMIRAGMLIITTGNQIQTDSPDLDLDQAGFLQDLLTKKDKDGKAISSYDQAMSIHAEQGQPNDGVDLPKSLKVFGMGNPFDFIDSFAGVLDPVCSALSSTAGQVIGLAFSGGPIGAVVQAGIGLALQPVLESVAHWAAGDAVDPFAAGADLGNIANYGSRLAANDQALAAAGTALTGAQLAELKSYDNWSEQQDFHSKSLAYQVFNPYDSRSMFAQFIDHNNISLGERVTGLFGNIGNIGNMFGSLGSHLLFGGHALAANTYDYGFPKYGFSAEDLTDQSVQNPYKNAAVARDLLEGPNGSKFQDAATKCFGVTIQPDQNGDWNVTGGNDIVNAYDSATYNSDECINGPTTKADWIHIRFFVFDTETMSAAACYNDDDQACGDIGFTGSATPDNNPSSIPPTGDSQSLAKQILANNKITYTTDLAKQAMQAAAAGKPSAIETRCNTGRNSAPLSANLLSVILQISQTHSIGIGYLTNGCHSATSPHYDGRAVDLNTVDGAAVTGGTAADRKFMHEVTGILPDGSGMGQVSCSSTPINPIHRVNLFDDGCDHIHFQVGN